MIVVAAVAEVVASVVVVVVIAAAAGLSVDVNALQPKFSSHNPGRNASHLTVHSAKPIEHSRN